MPGLREEAKNLLRRLEASARKKLGQNFMVDENMLRFIAASLEIKPGDAVVEIGPGLGFLTRYLLELGARVTAVEKDAVYVQFLSGYFPPANFRVVENDVLESSLAALTPETQVKVIGNIPYNITSPILEWLVLQKSRVSEAVLTVQWEVAERLGAKPGSKTWGALSVYLAYHARIEVLKKIPPGCFSPEPKVDSAVIRLVFLSKPPCEVKDETFFFATVRRAFQKRRKTLLNALVQDEGAFSKACVEQALKGAGIDGIRRPETLTLAEWALVTNRF